MSEVLRSVRSASHQWKVRCRPALFMVFRRLSADLVFFISLFHVPALLIIPGVYPMLPPMPKPETEIETGTNISTPALRHALCALLWARPWPLITTTTPHTHTPRIHARTPPHVHALPPPPTAHASSPTVNPPAHEVLHRNRPRRRGSADKDPRRRARAAGHPRGRLAQAQRAVPYPECAGGALR